MRADGLARIVGGTDTEHHEDTVPAQFGLGGDAASLVVDQETFTVAEERGPYFEYKPVFALRRVRGPVQLSLGRALLQRLLRPDEARSGSRQARDEPIDHLHRAHLP